MTDRKPADPKFSKRLNHSIVAATCVLGKESITHIIDSVLSHAITMAGPGTLTAHKLKAVLDLTEGNLVDKNYELKIKTGAFDSSLSYTAYTPANEADDGLIQGYTTVDLKSAIAEAIEGDLVGFILECIQLKFQRDLTIQDAQRITQLLNELLKFLPDQEGT